MNENMVKIRVTVQRLKGMAEALESLSDDMEKNPKLFAALAESPLEDMRRLRDELDHYIAEIKQVAVTAAS
jgi:hypothetical protein